MTLRLVSDSTVSELPVYNFQDIAGCARKFADQFEAGDFGEAEKVIVIIQGEGLHICGWGENSSAYEMMGLFEAAKLTAFADHVAGED